MVVGVLLAPLLAGALTPAPLAFSFTPAGLLFPYYVGVAYKLADLGLLQPSTPIGGSSAGAIVAAAVACGASEDQVLHGLNALLADYKAGSSLNQALRRQLEAIMPEDAHEVAQRHGLTVGYLEVLPRPGRRLVSEWMSKQDLIDTVCASCNWPLFFSRWPLVWCRGGLCLDGFFSVDRARFGCPPLECERQVAISALPRVSIDAFDAADIIQPAESRFPSAPLPISDGEWFSYALNPAAPTLISDMVGLGRKHAVLWDEAQREE